MGTGSLAADIAYFVCIVSIFIAGGIAIYLLMDKIRQNKAAHAKKSVRKKPARKAAAKKPAAKMAAKRKKS